MAATTEEGDTTASEGAARRPRVAFFDFAGCEGCQLQIANLEEEILKVVEAVDIVSFREIMKEHSDRYDVAFVEGSIGRPMDEERLRRIRERAGTLIALGDCAVTGGVNKLRNHLPGGEALEHVYPGEGESTGGNPLFDVTPARSVCEVVDVDFVIRGCPVRSEQVLYYIRRLVTMPPRRNLDLRFDITPGEAGPDERSLIHYDPGKCVLCRHCAVICNDVLGVHALGLTGKGGASIIGTPFDIGLDRNRCISCGQCLVNCPVGAFSYPSSVETVLRLLGEQDKRVVFVLDPVAVASAVEVMPVGGSGLKEVMARLVGALRSMNAGGVVDFTGFVHLSLAAQGEHVGNGGGMTFTSWCPAAHRYVETFLPQYRRNLHGETSPASLMASALQARYPGEDLATVLVSPCIAYRGDPSIDAVLTAAELPRLLAAAGVELDFCDPGDGAFDRGAGPPDPYFPGAGGDCSYALPIIEAAYMGRFNDLDVRLDVNPLGSAAHELAFDSEEGFFNALVVEDISRAGELLRGEGGKYNVVELHPCLHGCLTGGGMVPTTSPDRIEARRALLREYAGEPGARDRFIARLIEAYDAFRGVA